MEKIKKVFGNINFLLVLIVLLGLILRLLNIYKQEGFWLDEAYSFVEAGQSFPFGILNYLSSSDIHMPLYFFILHFWMKIFGNHDVAIRLLSVLFGVLTIPVSYFAGIELCKTNESKLNNFINTKSTALTAAILTGVSSFAVYYSQEVRHYSMQGLLGVLILFFLLKIKNNPDDNKNYIYLAISNICAFYTFNVGFVLILAEFLMYFLYLHLKKENTKKWIKSLLITTLFFLPGLSFLINNSQKFAVVPVNLFETTSFNYTNVLLVFQNWFSPFLGGLESVFAQYYEAIFSTGLNFQLVVLLIVPVIIGITGVAKSLFKNKFNLVIFTISILFILAEITATLMGKAYFITRSTMFVYIPIIILLSYGLNNFQTKNLSKILIGFLVAVNLISIILLPSSAIRIPRTEGYRYVGNILNSLNLTNKDIIIMPWGGKFLGKYYSSEKAQILPFEYIDAFLLWKKDQLNNVFDENIINNTNRANIRENLKPYISSATPSQETEIYVKKQIADKLEKGRYFVLFFPKFGLMYENKYLQNIVNFDETYQKQPMYFMLCSKMTNNIIIASKKYMKINYVGDKGPWIYIIFEKL